MDNQQENQPGNPWLTAMIGILVANRPLNPKPHGLPQPLIVSLTSFPPRFGTLPLTLQSLLTQTMIPDRIILWIAHEDRNLLTEEILGFHRSNIEIRFCENLRSYKKIIPALQEFPDHFIVTADDDVYYWPTWLEELVTCYDPTVRVLPAHRVHRIRLNDQGMPLPYMQWQWNYRENQSGHILNFPTGCGGVLYAPQSLAAEVTNVTLLRKLCPTADDIWLYWMAIRACYFFKPTGTGNKLVNWPFTQEINLSKDNCLAAGNDVQIARMNDFQGIFPLESEEKASASAVSSGVTNAHRSVVGSSSAQSSREFSRYHRPEKNLIVTGLPRSGTSLLCVLLNQMANTVCVNEVLYDVEKLPLAFAEIRRRLDNGQPIPNKFDDKSQLTTDTQRNPCQVAERVVPHANAEAIVASKVNIPYLDRLDSILAMGCKVIALVRDPVYTIASWRSDQVKNIPEAMVADDNMHPRWRGFRFAAKDPLIRQAQIWEHYAALLCSRQDRLLLIRYEDLTERADETLARIAAYLGRDYSGQATLQNKNSPARFGDLSEIERVVSIYCPSSASLGYPPRATNPVMNEYQPRDYWEQRGKDYRVDKTRYNSDIEIEQLKNTIIRLGLSQRPILEIGSGYGRILQALDLPMPHFTMCDFADSMRYRCQERTGILPDYWDGETLPYRDDAFDLVILFSVLLHVPPASIAQFMKEATRVTKRYMYIATNTEQSQAPHVFNHDYLHLFGAHGLHIVDSKTYDHGRRTNWLLEKVTAETAQARTQTGSTAASIGSRLARWLQEQGALRDRDFLLEILPQHSIGAEIGVHLGDFSWKIMEKVQPQELNLIDPWEYCDAAFYAEALYGGKARRGQEEMERRYALVCARFRMFDAVKIHRGRSAEVLERFPDHYFDWVYIDGNHCYDFVKKDLELAFLKVKPGGLITGDDYRNDCWWQDGVTKAVDEFAAHPEVDLLGIWAYQFIFLKRDQAR